MMTAMLTVRIIKGRSLPYTGFVDAAFCDRYIINYLFARYLLGLLL